MDSRSRLYLLIEKSSNRFYSFMAQKHASPCGGFEMMSGSVCIVMCKKENMVELIFAFKPRHSSGLGGGKG